MERAARAEIEGGDGAGRAGPRDPPRSAGSPRTIGRGPRLPSLRTAGGSPATYATRTTRMRTTEPEGRALLHTAQQERNAALGPGRVATTLQVVELVM